MNEIIKTSRAEWIKVKGLGLVYAAIVLAFLPSLLQFISLFLMRKYGVTKDIPISVFEDFTSSNFGIYAKFLIILFIVIASNRICQIDHKNGGWLLMETQPVSKFNLYLAKYFNLVFLTFISILSYFIFCYVFGIVWQTSFALVKSSWNFDLIWHLQAFSKLFLSSLGMAAFMLFISMVIPSYIWPFMIGILGLLLNLMSVIRKEHYLFSPLYTEQLAFGTPNVRTLNSFIGFSETLSLFWTVLFITIGYLWYANKAFKRAFLSTPRVILRTSAILFVSAILFYFIQKPQQIPQISDSVLISGTITSKEQPKELFLTEASLSTTIATLPVIKGRFKWTSDQKLRPGIYLLKSDNGRINSTLLISDGSKYDIDFYLDDMRYVEFSRNNRKAEYELLNTPLAPEIAFLPHAFGDKPEEYYTELEELWNKISKKLDNYRTVENYGAAEDFKEFKIQTEAIQMLIAMEEYEKKHNKSGKEIKAADRIKTLLRKRLEKPTELTLQSPLYINYQLNQMKGNGEGKDAVLDRIKSMEKGELRDRILTTEIRQKIEAVGDSTQRQQMVATAFNEISDEKHKQHLQEILNQLNRDKRGVPFPPVPLTDVNEKVVNLSDFRGKYVILHLWSYEGKTFEKNLEHFNQKSAENSWYSNLVFVTLNTDPDHDQWKKSLSKIPSEDGIKNLRLKNPQALPDVVNNVRLPQIIILSPDGSIYNFNAPKAEDPAFSAVLNAIGQR